MTASTTSIFRWAARVLAVLFSGISILAADAFREGYGFFDIIVALLIPIFIIVIVFLAWKRELVGALVFTALSVAYGVGAVNNGAVDWWFAFGAPMLLMGILYFISWRGSKQVATSST
jgi:hypothetical protein